MSGDARRRKLNSNTARTQARRRRLNHHNIKEIRFEVPEKERELFQQVAEAKGQKKISAKLRIENWKQAVELGLVDDESNLKPKLN